MRNIFYILVIVAVCLFFVLPATADDDSDKELHEYRIRVAFIYNFLKFVDWPGENSPRKTETATVCIIGDRKFAEYFGKLQGTFKQPLLIYINYMLPYSDIPTCHILLIGKDEEENALSILSHTQHHPVLSISSAENFADNGGIIEIVRVDKNVGLFSQDKINLRINLKAAESSGLAIDARLLQIAQQVIK